MTVIRSNLNLPILRLGQLIDIPRLVVARGWYLMIPRLVGLL